jgi:hypothetical protein
VLHKEDCSHDIEQKSQADVSHKISDCWSGEIDLCATEYRCDSNNNNRHKLRESEPRTRNKIKFSNCLHRDRARKIFPRRDWALSILGLLVSFAGLLGIPDKEQPPHGITTAVSYSRTSDSESLSWLSVFSLFRTWAIESINYLLRTSGKGQSLHDKNISLDIVTASYSWTTDTDISLGIIMAMNISHESRWRVTLCWSLHIN